MTFQPAFHLGLLAVGLLFASRSAAAAAHGLGGTRLHDNKWKVLFVLLIRGFRLFFFRVFGYLRCGDSLWHGTSVFPIELASAEFYSKQ